MVHVIPLQAIKSLYIVMEVIEIGYSGYHRVDTHHAYIVVISKFSVIYGSSYVISEVKTEPNDLTHEFFYMIKVYLTCYL